MYRTSSRWTVSNNELYHHGIKGQKWGVRRYQNEDGTYTNEGKERYFGKSSNKVKDFAKTLIEQDEKTNKWELSDRGKKILKGSAITAGALIAATGAGVIIYKSGGLKQVANIAKSSAALVKNMPTDKLKTFVSNNKDSFMRLATKRFPDGASNAKAKVHVAQLTHRMINLTTANTELNKRATESAISNLMEMPTKFAEYISSPERMANMENVLKQSADKTTVALLSIGSTAVVGKVAYDLKEKLDKEDETGTKGRYMAPNPNKKK